MTLTRTANDVYNPVTLGGQPRGASMAEARDYHVEVEDAVEALQANVAALQALVASLQADVSLRRVYSGRVDGAFTNLPSGWILSITATGVYRIIHNLAIDPGNYTVVPAASSNEAVFAQRSVQTPNYFEIVIVNQAGALVAASFGFLMQRTSS